jgi:uncharacterized membrane protein
LLDIKLLKKSVMESFYYCVVLLKRNEGKMKYFKTFLTALGFIALFYLIAPNRIYGYLDAGTGSYIIQIIIAVAIGGAFGIKIFWRRIYGFFKKTPNKKEVNAKDKK